MSDYSTAKPYYRNPRQITKSRLEKLRNNLARFGDLGGIVHNVHTDEIIGGNQRTHIFQQASTVEIVEQLEAPDEQGTIALGYIVWRGKKYSYRRVDWDAETAAAANLVANVGAGQWDWDIFANQWNPAELMEWGGFDVDTLKEWKRDVAALGNFLGSEAEPDDPIAEWDGMPEFENESKAVKSIIVHFESEEDILGFSEIVGQKIGEKTKFIWYPEKEKRNLKEIAYVAEES